MLQVARASNGTWERDQYCSVVGNGCMRCLAVNTVSLNMSVGHYIVQVGDILLYKVLEMPVREM